MERTFENPKDNNYGDQGVEKDFMVYYLFPSDG